uniref:Uncharacterized protein n=1 Tax=Onchocerca volvulus TaxID=6282 RepID=A0A8R1U0W0_ONCVO
MSLRRRSRRLPSQEPEDFSTCSSIDVLGVVLTKIESNDESKRTEEINIEKKENSSTQSSPVALRTRSRSRCSSMESNDAVTFFMSFVFSGINGDIQKAISIKLTPKKVRKVMTPVKLCRKRTSLMPELEEIVEEQLKCIDEDNSGEKLMEGKTETKRMSKKKRELLENDRAHVEVHSERNPIKKFSKVASVKDVESDLTKPQRKNMKTAWNKSDGSPRESSAKVTNNAKMFLAKNPETSPAKVLQEFPKMNQKEMLTNNSSSFNDHLEEEARFITGINLEENNLNIWPKLDDPLSLWLRRSEHNIFVDNIGRAYAFVNGVEPEVPSISQELITTNSETIWQQIAYGNKKFYRYFTKKKHFLDVELPTDKKPDEKSGDSFSSVIAPKFKDESSDNTEEDNADLFNLTEDQIKRLDKNISDSKMCKNDDDNDSNASNSESVCVSGISDSFSKKRWKSAVDDHFFSLAEMEEYLDKQERDQAHLDENFFEQFDKDGDDFKNSQTDYDYADFYESRNNNDKKNGIKSASKKLNKSTENSQSIEMNNRTEKRVTFADDIANDIDKNDDDDSHGSSQEATVLLGQVGERNNETEFQHRQKKLRERISSIEQANLAPRSWDLSGEVTAIEREENTMLEKHLDFDQSAPCAPVITVDTTAQLEAKIVQRIKDRVFDDVLRTEHKPETNVTYRAPVVESETVKKSLAEVYEEQYQKTQYETGNEEKINAKHEEIKKLLSSLFQKLNALSHYRYIPSEVHSEVRILNNMPSLQKEEVGPLASTDAVLLAPEEIHKHISGAFKGDDEKTKTDRSRSHRKKKKWQHIKQFKKQEIELATTKNEMLAKKPKLISQYDNKNANIKLTSASFFQCLQTKTAEKVKVKKYRTTEMDAAKKKLSTNYKL